MTGTAIPQVFMDEAGTTGENLLGVQTGAKAPDRFARELEDAGVADLVFNVVGPESDDGPALRQVNEL